MSASELRFVAAADGDVGSVLAEAGIASEAVAEGRVFVGTVRAKTENDALRAGAVLRVMPSVPLSAELRAIEILYHAKKWLVVVKPAGIPTIPDQRGSAHSLQRLAAAAAGVPEGELHPTSRLDREVSGVVTFALSKGAAAHLLEARKRDAYRRRYVALAVAPPVSNAPSPLVESGTWNAPIGRAADPKLRKANGKDPRPAATHYRVAASTPGGKYALLACAPVTGRTHQIRVHASLAGMPLLGDKAYGGPTRVVLPSGRVVALDRISLHAARVELPAPWDSERGLLVFDAKIPPALLETWEALGGDRLAWEGALACDLP